jgi:hypothetical protein
MIKKNKTSLYFWINVVMLIILVIYHYNNGLLTEEEKSNFLKIHPNAYPKLNNSHKIMLL